MSASVYTATPVGTVNKLPDSTRFATFALIKPDPSISFEMHKAIITSWVFNENVNVQFTHTMGNDIYLNVFGNRMGTLSINGLSFNAVGKQKNCDPGQNHGIVDIIKWYRDNRISNPNGPGRVKVVLGGGEPVEGYLIGASYRANDPVNYTVEYSLQLAAIPK